MIYLNPPYDPHNFDRREQGLVEAVMQNKFLSLYIESSAACNLKCKFCDLFNGPQTKLGKANIVLKPDHFEYMLCDIQQLGYQFKRVYFNVHGEPLINRDLATLVSLAVTANIGEHYTVSTNGVLLNTECFDALVDSGINSITVSHETVSRQRYAEFMGADHLEAVMTNVSNAIAKIKNGTDIQLIIKTTQLKNATSEDKFYLDELIEHYKPVAEYSNRIHISINPEWSWVSGQVDEAKPKELRCCDMPFYMAVLHCDGRVSCCCVDNIGSLVIGKIDKEGDSLSEILKGTRLKKIREAHLNGSFGSMPACANCDAQGGVNPLKYKDKILSAMEEW